MNIMGFIHSTNLEILKIHRSKDHFQAFSAIYSAKFCFIGFLRK